MVTAKKQSSLRAYQGEQCIESDGMIKGQNLGQVSGCLGQVGIYILPFTKIERLRWCALGFNMGVHPTSKGRRLCASDESKRRVLSCRYGPGNQKQRAYEGRTAKR